MRHEEARCALEAALQGPLGLMLEEAERKRLRAQRWDPPEPVVFDGDVLKLVECRTDVVLPGSPLAAVLYEAARAATEVEDLALEADREAARFVVAKAQGMDAPEAALGVLAACRGVHAVTRHGTLSSTFVAGLADLMDRDDLASCCGIPRADLRDAAKRLADRAAKARALVVAVNRRARVVSESRTSTHRVHDWRNELRLVARANNQHFNDLCKTPPDQSAFETTVSSRHVALTLAALIRAKQHDVFTPTSTSSVKTDEMTPVSTTARRRSPRTSTNIGTQYKL